MPGITAGAWLEAVPQITALIDFGPRIAAISPALFTRMMACRPIVTLNRQEASAIAQAQALPAGIAALGAAWLTRFGSPLIVRLDGEGARYFSAAQSGAVPAFPATVVDTIGAGDSHAGGVLAGLAAGWTLAEAVELGNAVAAWVVSRRGGGCAPSREALILACRRACTRAG